MEFREGDMRGERQRIIDQIKPRSNKRPKAPPMPNVKPTKDRDIEDYALRTIMSLAVFGSVIKATQDGEDQGKAISECMKLFKDAGFID